MTSRATNLHSSRLIRVLADLVIMDACDPGTDFAEQLSRWLDHHDAIVLRAVHTTRAPIKLFGVKSVAADDINEEFIRIRSRLVNSITMAEATKSGKSTVALCSPALDVSMDSLSAYEPYRRYYLEHQRNMALTVRALRAHVREVLTRASPKLNQLAALDAVLDEILCDRESKLLSTVPSLLARRFEQLRKAHPQTLDVTQQADSPATWMQVQDWLTRFCNELKTVLLAELDVRLQPTAGLIEAFNNKMKPYQ